MFCSHVWYDLFIWFPHMSYSYVWHDSNTSTYPITWGLCLLLNEWNKLQTWLINTCDMPHSYLWHASFIRVTWLIHTCDMPYSYLWRALFVRVTCLIHTGDMIYSYVWRTASIRVTWLIHICTHTPRIEQGTTDYTWHDSFICVTRLIDICDTWLIHTCDVTHSYIHSHT